MIPLEHVEIVEDLSSFGVHAFTTTRAVGSFSTGSDAPVRDVMGRWDALRATVASHGVRRLATAWQVHGADVLVHNPGWEGWLRGTRADGHLVVARGGRDTPLRLARHGGANRRAGNRRARASRLSAARASHASRSRDLRCML